MRWLDKASGFFNGVGDSIEEANSGFTKTKKNWGKDLGEFLGDATKDLKLNTGVENGTIIKITIAAVGLLFLWSKLKK